MINEFKKHFQVAFERINDPLLIVDTAGYILDFNPAARTALEIGESEHISDVISLEKSFVFEGAEILPLLTRPGSVFGMRLKDDEGNPSDVVLDVLELDTRKTGQSTQLIHIKDFSGHKTYERWKDELVSMVAHEIKNPLSAMKNSMSILISQATGPVTGEQHKLLTTSIRGIDRLTRLLDGFLDMSRIGAGKYTLEPRWVNVHDFLPDAIDSFKTLFNVRRQTLDYEISSEIDQIFIDAPKLEQVLINLLSNAIKFTPQGGSIDVSVVPANLGALSEDLRVLDWGEITNLKFFKVIVRDNGIGMTGETVSHLFTRYYQKGDGGGLKGSHLGLSISKALTEVQYGSLEIESEPGVGTEATVHLPEDENTTLLLSRIRSMERCLARVIDTKRDSDFLVIRKAADDSWKDVLAGCGEQPLINPTPDAEKTAAFLLWTLSDRFAVVMAHGGHDAAPVLHAVSNPQPDDQTAPSQAHYTTGRCKVPRDGTGVAQLLKLALHRIKNPSPTWSKV